MICPIQANYLILVVLNNELQHVHSWLSANRLTLNVQKTKYMLFHKNKSNDIGELNLRICNDAIQSVNEFNFLGLYINSKLNWDTHTLILLASEFRVLWA